MTCFAAAAFALFAFTAAAPARADEVWQTLPPEPFRGANRDLLRVTLRYLLPIGIGLSLIGAWQLTDLQ